ncbi:MAG: tripartite tricarboxylate transporter TctB family protein, partial [Chloroflexi bacterium]|nr:tripartite tricarboxylate transporter TctB family protein [Chloroflexota bacterium]
TWPYLQSKLTVFFAAGGVLLLALIQIVREVGGKVKKADPTAEEGEIEDDIPLGLYFREALWVIAFVLGIYFFGFFPSILVFGIVYMLKHETKLRQAVAVGAGTAVVTYLLFTGILDMRLWEGLVFRALS